jgi:trimeric autotransporter adhesin
MAVTRIKNNQITDATITAQKIANQTLVGSLFSPDLTLSSNVSIVGNLTVTGNTSNINAINTFITDPFVIFNNGYNGSLANYTIGFLVNRNLASLTPYGAVNTAWIWSEADSAFVGLATTDTGVGITSINNSGYANIKIGNLEVVTSVTASNFNIGSATITGGSAGTLQVTNLSTGNAVISGGYISSLANATVTTGNTQNWYATTLNSTTGNITTLTSTTVNAGTTTSAILNATTGNITTLGAGTTTSAILNATTGNITNLGVGTTTTAVLNATTGNITTGNAQTWYATQLNSTTGNITTLGVGTTTTGILNATTGNVTTGNAQIWYATQLNSTTGNITTLGVGTTTSAILNATTGNITTGNAQIWYATQLNSTTGNITTLGVGTTTTGILNATTGNITTLGAGTTTTATLNTTNGNITNGNATTFVATNFSSGNAVVTGGSANSFKVGNTTPDTGAFTALTSNGLTTFTNATQSDNASSGAVVVTGGVGIGANLNVAGNVTITGNLTVLGNTTTLNTEVLNVEDLNITVAANATTGSDANGAGLTVAGANATFTYLNADDSWNLNKKLNATTVGAAIVNITTANVTTGNAQTWYATNLNATNGNITTLGIATINASTSNVTNGNATTFVATNFSSGNAVVTGGSINNTVIGNTTPAAGTFTNLRATGNIVAASGVNATNFTTGALVVPGGGGVGITGDLQVQGQSTFQGNINAGNIILSGNINVSVGAVQSSFGVFYGNAGGIGALYAGTSTYTALPTTVFQMTADVDSYGQVNFQNRNSGTSASTDYVATADNGDDNDGYINLGINSSTFADPDFPGYYPNDGYLVMHGIEPSTGNLNIHSHNTGSVIKLIVGAFGDGNVRAAVTNTGFRVNTATASTSTTTGALLVDGGVGIAGNLYAAGNVILGTGTTSNVVVAATTASTNTTTGALVVRGGAGIAGAVNIGGQIVTTAAGTATDGSGQLYLNGATSNRIDWNTNGTGAPAFTTRSAGTKLLLYPSLTGGTSDYAMGIDAATLWSSIPENTTGFNFKWYGATTQIASLGGTGILTVAGNIVAASGTTSTSTDTGALVVVGGAGISGNINIGGNINSPSNIVVNSTNSVATSFIVRGVNDNTLIWAKPSSTYDSVVIGNSATTGDLVTGAKLFINTTDSIRIPTGTTAQRPSSAGGTDVVGMTRMNSTTTQMEYYDGFQWRTTGGAQFTIIESDSFTGDDSTLDFTLAGNTTTNGCMVSINGIVQNPSSAYSVGGALNKTLTFTQAPASGDTIDVRRFTTTSTISSFSSQNGYSSVIANNDALIFTSGPTSAVERLKLYPNGNVVVTGNIIPGANLTYNLGSTTAWWNVIYGKATQATYADLAENYQADSLYSAGTVLEFGGEFEVTACMDENSTRVAGVVSTNPAHLMNGGLRGSNVVPLALQGRVPCMVVGPVRKGDMMVSAGYGYAKASSSPSIGTVIGKSLANFDGDKGVIEVVVGRV